VKKKKLLHIKEIGKLSRYLVEKEREKEREKKL